MNICSQIQDRVDRSLIMPQVNWRNASNDCRGHPSQIVSSASAQSNSGKEVSSPNPKRVRARLFAAQSGSNTKRVVGDLVAIPGLEPGFEP